MGTDDQRSVICGTSRAGLVFLAQLLALLAGGLDKARKVFAGRCKRVTISISSSLLRRSRSLRLIPTGKQPNRRTARGDDLTPAPLLNRVV